MDKWYVVQWLENISLTKTLMQKRVKAKSEKDAVEKVKRELAYPIGKIVRVNLACQKEGEHEFRELDTHECGKLHIIHWGSCFHVYQCVKCGLVITEDSSD